MSDLLVATGEAGAGTTTGRVALARSGRRLARLRHVWLLAVVLVAWEYWAREANMLFLPPISKIAERFWDQWFSGPASQLFLSDAFYDAAGPTMSRFAYGWLGALVIGVAVGTLLGRSRVAYAMYSPVIRFFLSVPKVALLPIAVQVFGITSSMNVALIFVGCVLIIAVNTMDGIGGIHETYLMSARSLRLGKLALYRDVILPAASPRILAGARVSLGMGLILTIVSEFYATTSGIGYQIQLSQQGFRYLDMWAAIMLIAVIGILLNGLMSTVERRLLRWQQRRGLAEA